MKQTVGLYDFRRAFQDYGRYKHFSYEGYEALFDWLEEYDECSDTETELDVIALCCDYTEYENLEELQDNYNDIKSMDDLQDNTIVIYVGNDDGFIIQNF